MDNDIALEMMRHCWRISETSKDKALKALAEMAGNLFESYFTSDNLEDKALKAIADTLDNH
jgi:hypothetical protein